MIKEPSLPLDQIERSLNKTYKKDLFNKFLKAIIEYELLEPNDKVAIAISGGKDSLVLAKLFQELKRHNKYPFELEFISMDPGFSKENKEQLLLNCKYLGIPLKTYNSDIFAVLDKIAKEAPCYMCARMRRGFLYAKAKELGCNKLALGHHYDDVIETTMLNIFYGGQFKTMVPKIQADNFEGIELIRPLTFVLEKDVIRWLNYSGINAMNCGCTVTQQKVDSKRREIKELIKSLEKTNPTIKQSIFKACQNVNIDAILGYKKNGEYISFNGIYSKKGGK